MRERTTWVRSEIAKLASSLRVAEDPRAMNQDHLSQQPAADKYVTGGPSDFAEDVHPSSGTWKAEYSGNEVKRNEIGMPEFRGDTFNHPEKTAAQQQQDEEDDDDTPEFLEKKADVCLSLARRMLPKSASARAVEDQALAFMYLPNSAIIETSQRLAAEEDEEQKKQAQQQQGQGQASDEEQKKQAQQQQGQGSDEEQKKQAQQQAQQAEEEQKKQAQQQAQQQAEEEQKKQAQQQQGQASDDEQQKQAAALAVQACQAMQSGNPQQAQQAISQMVQQLAQQQPVAQQDSVQLSQQIQQMVQQAFQQMQGQGQQQPVAQQQQIADDQLLDQMLQQPAGQQVFAGASVASMDVELAGPSMDVGEIHLGSEDEALATLFASHNEVREAAHAQSLQTGMPVQASGTNRTASTRTVGTRPSAGVSQLGGGSSMPKTAGEVDKLSGLWQTAPDVSSVFSV